MFVRDITVVEMARFSEEGSIVRHNLENESVTACVVERIFFGDGPAVEAVRYRFPRLWKVGCRKGFLWGMAGHNCLA